MIHAESVSGIGVLKRPYIGLSPLKTMLGLYRRHWRQMVIAAFFYVVKQSPIWVMPLITANVIDIVSTRPPNALRSLGLNAAVLAFVIIQNIPTHIVYYGKMSEAARNVEADLRAAIVRRLQQLSISFYKNNSPAVLQAKVLRDVEAVDQMTRQVIEGLLSSGVSTVAAVVVTALRAPRFLPVFLITVPLVFGLRKLVGGALKTRNTEFRHEIEGMTSNITGMIDMIPMTRAHGVEETEIEKVAKKLNTVRKAGLRLDYQNALFGSVSWVSFTFFNMASLFLAGWLAYTRIIPLTPGDVVMLGAYFGAITNAMMLLANMMPVVTKGFESVRSIGEVLECPDLEMNLGKAKVGSVNGDFTFESVSFTYSGAGRDSICDLSFRIQAGETLGIAGPSGSGKSTLMSLILGFDRPTSGRILLDGKEMNEFDLRSYRSFVGVVSQETLLFEGTVRENVVYGSQKVTDEEVTRALREADALEFIELLPQGLQTRIGERGARLSGGQKQRIAIARALLRNPRILILDEATSALDAAAEAQVQAALDRLMRGRTTFIVAHRLSTIRNAARIMVLRAGRIVEIGPPGDLASRGGAYAELLGMASR